MSEPVEVFALAAWEDQDPMFRTPEGERRSAQRRYGLSPRPVGKPPLIDRANLGYAAYQRVQKRLRG